MPSQGYREEEPTEASSDRVEIYDTTLRDGAQGEGIAFSPSGKCAITRLLDRAGVDFVEGGWPHQDNLRDREFFRMVRDLPPLRAQLAAFGSTCRAGCAPEADPQLNALLDCGAPVLALVGKTWRLHVTEVLRCTLDENLRIIEESIAYLKANGRQVFFDAEHFFDGFSADAGYALNVLRAAESGGVDRVILCDTNGGQLPSQVTRATEAAIGVLGGPLGIHTHNDSGCAVANAIAAVQAGCTQVQGTVNGYGERCGNADLCVLVPNLRLKLGRACLDAEGLQTLASISASVAEITGNERDRKQPYVGASAFAHKAGFHQDGVVKVSQSFEHVDPQVVGNCRRMLLSDQSGAAAVAAKLGPIMPGATKRSPQVRQLLERVRQLEMAGYQFEGADASFELLAREVLLRKPRALGLGGVATVARTGPDTGPDTVVEAELELTVSGRSAQGRGQAASSFGALERALRESLATVTSAGCNTRATRWRLRTVDGVEGSPPIVRATVSLTDGRRSWTTVGAHEDPLWALALALLDGYGYPFLTSEAQDSLLGDAHRETPPEVPRTGQPRAWACETEAD